MVGLEFIGTRVGLLRRWFWGKPVKLSTPSKGSRRSTFVMTGPDLIERVTRSIQLGQSVLLEGPRGCGKSYCVARAIKTAASRGYIPANAEVFVQGNRELPRDYLAEDEIAFRLENAGSKSSTVRPYRRSAPLFRFAQRTAGTGEPVTEADGVSVVCAIDQEQPLDRFVLNLDEINRFSDGVLDSLLSVLEERAAVLAGRKFVLPVTVCMTMNPPGYDSSARKLSPPLAARIGRNYRLSTPDLDTLTDLIVTERWDKAAAEYERDKDASIHRNQELIKQLEAEVASGVTDKDKLERLEDRLGQARRDRGIFYSAFPKIDPLLIRKAALVTLCLWGDVTAEPRDPGMEYLTDETCELLESVMQRDRLIADSMRQLSGLCHYGPDGRAVADWIVSATAKALDNATILRQDAELRPDHLLDTVNDTISHKIYDKFSPATQPQKTRDKEAIVDRIARQVLTRRGLDDLLARAIDNLEGLWERIGCCLVKPRSAQKRETAKERVRAAFIYARVTSDKEVAAWEQAIELWKNGKSPADALCKAHPEGAEHGPLLISEGVSEFGVEKPGFSNARYDELARSLVKLDGLAGFGVELKKVVGAIGPVRQPLQVELAGRSIVDQIGVVEFMESCKGFEQQPAMLLILADAMEDLSHRNLLAEMRGASRTGESGKAAKAEASTPNPAAEADPPRPAGGEGDRKMNVDRFIQQLKDELYQGTRERINRVHGEQAGEDLIETHLEQLRHASKALLDLAADRIYASGVPGSDDQADLLRLLANAMKKD